ncbi:hypothetical protein HII36_13840 [Nonomuraea sp. NN258]|uniref:hypothetical protein n=1 Tax=Nonomuraea antri TaxID=2730852 RepID=UPI00156A262C|nr:hypothetical protein [Nonomuraea antri]NRQ32915.1 hypothetical protein [Nonomuraea antri]
MKGSTIKGTILAAVIAAVGSGVMAAPSAMGATTQTAADDGGKAFTACVRSHGLPGFPDVTVSKDGIVNLDVRGERVDVFSAEYGEAVKACESLLPDGAGLPGKPEAPAAPPLPSGVPTPGVPSAPPLPD